MMETLTGYDARIPETALPALWDADRRGAFLLRDVPAPLSVDPLAWPSVFDLGHGAGMGAAERARLGLAGDGRQRDLPAWIGPHWPLWEDLDELRAYLRTGDGGRPGAPTVGWTLVAVTVCGAGHSSVGPDAGAAGPLARVDASWRRLGFDVAGDGLISGLSNCGYTAEEAAKLRPAWARSLNAQGLFDRFDSAEAFRALTDDRVPEHAPFRVHGLYRWEG